MSKKVLSIGQCGMDHGSIRRLIEGNFGAEVVAGDDEAGSLAKLRSEKFDLVLVNRQLDLDGSDGVALLRKIKQAPESASTPAMLVSNFADAQARAVEAGAEPGFGKSALHAPATLEKLKRFLS
jgi:two-component system chemotaxis response regulator CheY